MTEKIEHQKTGIIKINGGYQVVWKFNNQLFHIGYIGELDEIERYKVLFDNATTMLLAEKDAEIERLKLETEYFKSLLVTADFQHTRGAK